MDDFEFDGAGMFDYICPIINTAHTVDDSGVEDIGTKQYRKFIQKSHQVIKELQEFTLPVKGEQLRIVTFKSFNAVHFLSHIANIEKVDHVYLAIYSINHEAAILLNKLILSKAIKSATILMSNMRNKAHREKERLTRDMFVSNKNIDLFFCASHSKIISAKTSKGNYYTIEGSGNLAFNSRIEQYVIDNDDELYNFTGRWFDEIRVFLKNKKELVTT